jgi:hypothetical protein
MSQRAGRKDRRAPLHLAKFKDRLSDAEFGKNLASLSNQFAASADRSFESQKRGQLFIRVHNETLSIVAMHVCNEDSPGCGDYQRVG